MKIATYDEAVKYLETFIRPSIFKRITKEEAEELDPLRRMYKLLELLGNPQDKFKSVLVTGTAGKGSTAYLLSHILTISGYKTGLTISPHLEKINERMQIGKKIKNQKSKIKNLLQPIEDREFIKLLNSSVPVIEKMKQTEFGEPTYYEILLALAFIYFAKEKVDIAVVEVGLEGKFDATNVLTPLIVLLTNIYLDHTEILGETVAEIAKEAVFAIKNDSTVVTGENKPSVHKIIRERCKKTLSKLFALDKDFNYRIKKQSLNGSEFDFLGKHEKIEGLTLSLLGNYQVENATLAIESVLMLGNFGINVAKKNIREALKTAFFPGRFEVINNQIILDGAHNPDKMRAFVHELKEYFPKNKRIFVVAFKKDKNIQKMLRQISKIAEAVIITEFHATTDMSKNATYKISNLKTQIPALPAGRQNPKTKNIHLEADSKKAFAKARNLLENTKNSIIVLTGSLYFVGEMRTMLLQLGK